MNPISATAGWWRPLGGVLAVAATVLLLPRPAAAQSEASSAVNGISTSFVEGAWLPGDTPISIRLTEGLPPDAVRLAVLVGDTDWTGLFDVSPETLTLTPGSMRLPSGEHDLVVYSVTEGNAWQEIGRTRLRVLTPRGFEQASVGPQVDVTNAGQVLERHAPVSNLPPRGQFQDFAVTAALRSSLRRDGWGLRTDAGVLGVNTREQAVRFGEKGEDAPLVDLASYLVETGNDRVDLALGHVAIGRHRHLAQTFGSRGPVISVRPASAIDLTVAAVNGSAIAGFGNLFGLNDRNHQVASASLGIEAIPDRPGGLRIEAMYLDGSVLPVAGFNQGVINDAERSRGGSVQVQASDPAQRFRVDAGYSRSAFHNPFDPLLAGGVEVVAVQRVNRAAQYVDATAMLVQNARAATAAPVNLGLTFRHERVEPLYRSVAAPIRADFLQNAVELTGAAGQLTTQLSYSWDRDNLADIPSILTTKTRRAAATVTVPVMGFGAPSWSPLVTYTLDRTHQFGAGVPIDGGFNESHVPDQVSTQHAAGIEWRTTTWRGGYRFDRSLQDNRQIGRTLSDLFNMANTITAGATPRPGLDLDLELGFDKAENREFTQIDLTKRVAFSGTWQMATHSLLTGALSRIGMRDRDGAGESIATEMHLQFSRTVAFVPSNPRVLSGQLYVRAARQSSLALQLLFGVDERRSNWTLNTGFNLRVF